LLDAKNRKRVLVANLLPEAQEIKIKTGTGEARVLRLNVGTVEAAASAPEKFTAAEGELIQSVSGKIELSLAPYEVARVDLA
jgi:hypothetical protein